ncbi:MAG: MarC family protein [Proteobacteria bacterium]|nr:MarC family protein [Pseudomonadota bacterium]
MQSSELIKAFAAFFAIMNPFVTLPIFLALTNGLPVEQQRRLAVRVGLFTAAMCAVIFIAGHQIIGLFGVSVDQFRIAGGLVLAHIAWSMLNGAEVASHHGTADERQQMTDLSGLAFYPLTFPMIVGPGTMATLIIYGAHARSIEASLEVAAAVALVVGLGFVVLYFAAALGKLLGDSARVITTRLMGMILLAIAVGMVVAGLQAVLPGLAHASP